MTHLGVTTGRMKTPAPEPHNRGGEQAIKAIAQPAGEGSGRDTSLPDPVLSFPQSLPASEGPTGRTQVRKGHTDSWGAGGGGGSRAVMPSGCRGPTDLEASTSARMNPNPPEREREDPTTTHVHTNTHTDTPGARVQVGARGCHVAWQSFL